MKQEDLVITKSSGEKVPFKEEKLLNSLLRARVTQKEANVILDEVKNILYPGIPTKKIYKLAFKLLRKASRHKAARYHLKKAIMQLGPSGYPFEKYIAELLVRQGYKTQVGQIVEGHCISHEIDVIAEKENDYFMIECKYHNQAGIFCEVKIPLYINSRFRDVKDKMNENPEQKKNFKQGWIVTNTKFSYDAVKYGTCAGLHLVSWNYPAKGSLSNQIDSLGLYPITCLTSLTTIEKQRLLDNKIVLCKEINDNGEILQNINVSPARTKIILEECAKLCEESLKMNE